MTAECRKILTMLAEQKISVAEAEGLLDALESMSEDREHRRRRILIRMMKETYLCYQT